jgi:hypothetical protein
MADTPHLNGKVSLLGVFLISSKASWGFDFIFQNSTAVPIS